jgi:hypothetical protein
MSPIREVCLSLNDVEQMISGLEDKYTLSSADFFRDEKSRLRIPEDDVFHWQALVDHRRALKESYQEVRTGYLARLSHGGEVATGVEAQEQLAA